MTLDSAHLSTPLKRTPLFALHQKAQAKLVDFHGWEMPLHYGSQMEEHRAVRNNAGLFDVSHMTVIDITGKDAQAFLRFVLANDVAKLTRNKGLYSVLLNHDAGIIDDLIAYDIDTDFYRLVTNSGTHPKVLNWLTTQKQLWVAQSKQEPHLEIHHQASLCILALQGPKSEAIVEQAFKLSLPKTVLKRFHIMPCFDGWVARTGYTGEDGFEWIVPEATALKIWQALLAEGVQPVGLGARDTLRLEAGLNLYGNDMTIDHHPLEAHLGWTIAWEPKDRSFVGREKLEAIKASNHFAQMVGVRLCEKGVLRAHQKVHIAGCEGEMLSGTYSPTKEVGIGFARVNPHPTQGMPSLKGATGTVEIRGKVMKIEVVSLPFLP
jgi:aminomethyltransferase